MNLSIETKENELIIKIPNAKEIKPERVQQILDYIRYISNLELSGVDEMVADQLAEEIMDNWWERNKDKLLSKLQ